MSPVPTKEGSIVVLSHKGRLLIILRDDKPDIESPNHWAFPGGAKEEDESFEETAIREVKEELGLDIVPVEFLVELNYLNRRKMFYHFALSDKQIGEIKLTEGQKYTFFAPQEAQKLLLAPSTKMFLQSHISLIEDRI